MKFFKLLSAVIAMLVVISTAGAEIKSYAADSASFKLLVEKYSSVTNTYAAASVVSPGDLVCVSVNTDTNLERIGGIKVNLNYDKEKLSLQTNSSVCHIADANGVYQFGKNDANSNASAIWYTSSNSSNISGRIFSFYFKVNNVASNAIAGFSLSVNELFDSNSNNIAVSSIENASVTLLSIVFDSSTIDIFSKLTQIEYTSDCLQNITRADAAFAAFSELQLIAFRVQYPDLYNAYLSARNTYNNLGLNASMSAVQQEVDNFLTRNASVLLLTANSVRIEDTVAVTTANSEYKTLSDRAKAKLSQSVKDLLNTLRIKVATLNKDAKDLIENQEAADEFIKSYSLIWNLDFAKFKSDSMFQTMASEALEMYNIMLSDGAKALLTTQKSQLDQMHSWTQEIIKNDAAEQKILNEISEFQKKWIYVLTLNSANVGLGDESAINLMLKDFSTQSAELQKRLALKKTSAETLLTMIADMNKELNNTGTTDNTDSTDSTDSTVSVQTTEPEVITKTDTIIKTVTKTDVQTETDTKFIGNMPRIIIWLSAILAVSLVAMFVPIFILFKRNISNKRDGEIYEN